MMLQVKIAFSNPIPMSFPFPRQFCEGCGDVEGGAGRGFPSVAFLFNDVAHSGTSSSLRKASILCIET